MIGLSQQQGIKALSATDIGTLTARTITFKDVLGYDFVHVISTAPRTFTDPLAFGLTLTGTEWKLDPARWYTSVVGATTARSVVSAQEFGLYTLIKIAKTVQKVGGTGNVAAYVAFAPSFLTIKDKAGNFWPIGESTPMTAQQVEQQTKDYQSLVQQNSDAELAQGLQDNWNDVLTPLNQTTTGFSKLAVSSITDSTGNVNFQTLAASYGQPLAAIPSDGTIIRQSAVNTLGPTGDNLVAKSCWWWPLNFICSETYQGAMSDNKVQNLPGGYAQFPYLYDKDAPYQSQNYTLPRCLGNVTGNTQFDNFISHIVSRVAGAEHDPYQGLLGCGPATLGAVAQWLWEFDGAQFYGKPFETGESFYNYKMVDRSGSTPLKSAIPNNPAAILGNKSAGGMSRSQQYMGACTLNFGTWPEGQPMFNTATYPWKFTEGMQKFFDDQTRDYGTPKYTVTSNFKLIALDALPFINASNGMANAVRDGVGNRNFITVALYRPPSKPIFSMHYSPVLSYVVSYPHIRARIQTYVTTVDHPYDRVLISDPWDSFASGIYSIRQTAPATGFKAYVPQPTQKWTSSQLNHSYGSVDAEGNWSVVAGRDFPPADVWFLGQVIRSYSMSYGPSVKVMGSEWRCCLQADFELAIDNTVGTNDVVATIDAVTNYGMRTLGSRTLRRSDFAKANTFQTFPLVFPRGGYDEAYEFRIKWAGGISLKHRSTTLHDLEWQANKLFHTTGSAEGEGWAATSGTSPSPAYLIYGANYQMPIVVNAPLRAEFDLKVKDLLASNDEIARVQVYNLTTGQLLAEKVLNRSQFLASDQYQTFSVDFAQNPDLNTKYDFRVYWPGKAYVNVKKVRLVGL
ncbi:hypothetical protein [Deinococcus roseus]|uniref:hypothetical protein n=1 Tax=Deinococcus roseus TaxID=392414 RepID=UPI00166CB416|nr:hypothetical protein [Deinococcus roseus]